MSAASAIARRWKPLVVGALFAAGEAACINKLTSDNPSWWWWPLLVFALAGTIGCGWWALRFESTDSPDLSADNQISGSVGNEEGVITQQSAGAEGKNVAVTAQNGSLAAYRIDHIKEINIGKQPNTAREPRPSE
jgi:hypothetical protein